MVAELKVQTPQIQYLGIPLANTPKFKIGDYVRHVFEFGLGVETVEQLGRITAILAYEQHPGDPTTIVANYTYIVTDSNHDRLLYMVGEEDNADESELSLV